MSSRSLAIDSLAQSAHSTKVSTEHLSVYFTGPQYDDGGPEIHGAYAVPMWVVSVVGEYESVHGAVYYVTEFLAAQDLAEYIARSRDLPLTHLASRA
jgi:hypothetical protein